MDTGRRQTPGRRYTYGQAGRTWLRRATLRTTEMEEREREKEGHCDKEEGKKEGEGKPCINKKAVNVKIVVVRKKKTGFVAAS